MLTIEQFEHVIATNNFTLVYYSSHRCGVCIALRPKLYDLVKTEFTSAHWLEIDTETNCDITGQQLIFSAPAVQLFKHGHEIFRKSGIFSINEIKLELKRITAAENS